jgi:hypothetical protein
MTLAAADLNSRDKNEAFKIGERNCIVLEEFSCMVSVAAHPIMMSQCCTSKKYVLRTLKASNRRSRTCLVCGKDKGAALIAPIVAH